MKRNNFIFEKKFNFNQLFLKIILILLFVIISINFYEWVLKKSFFEYSDWLINYQGGFTRRGLFGEIIYLIHKLTFIRLDLLLFFLVISMYFLFFFFIYKILIKSNLNFLNSLILFSPLSFTYLASSKTLAGRKEILLFFLVSLFFYKLKNIKFENIKYWIIVILILSSLTHFGFIFYMPFLILFFIYLNSSKGIKELFTQVVPIIITSGVIVAIVFYSTFFSKPDLFEICESIKDYTIDCPEKTYIGLLDKSLSQVRQINLNFFDYNYFIKYPIYFILCFAPLFFAFKNLRDNKNFKRKNLICILFACSLLTSPVFFLGVDYGRYLNWIYIFCLFIYLYVINFNILISREKNNFFNSKVSKLFLYLIIFFYGFVWSVPHCCDTNYIFLFDKLFNQLFI